MLRLGRPRDPPRKKIGVRVVVPRTYDVSRYGRLSSYISITLPRRRAACEYVRVHIERGRAQDGGGRGAGGGGKQRAGAGKTLRTPEDRFAALPGFDYPPRYADA